MSDQELKQYFLDHREDEAAFQAYLIRLSKRRHKVITTVDDPEFDAKVQASVLQQVNMDEDIGQSSVW